MISFAYDFQQFLDAMAGKNYPEIIAIAEQELGSAEQGSRRTRGVATQRESMRREYAEQVGEFLFFMRIGVRPSNAPESDFKRYRPVCEALVEKGQFKPSILSQFTT